MQLCMSHAPPTAQAWNRAYPELRVRRPAASTYTPVQRPQRSSSRVIVRSGKQLVNYYEVLEVSEDADAEQLRTAYRVKAKVLHPDVNPAPNAAKQFLQLKRAYDTLKDALLRNEHDSKLGLASARAQDPRFARFERWRREVLPDLNVALDVWTAEVLRVIQEAEATLCQLQEAATAAAAAAAAAAPGGTRGRSVDAAPAAGAAGAATASPVPGAQYAASTPMSAGTTQQQQQEQKQQQQQQQEQQEQQGPELSAIELYSDMDRVLREAQGNVDRLYSKRYEQVCSMYPAYPDIVWYDVWEAVSEEWLLESRQLAGRWQQTVATGLQRHQPQGELSSPS